MVTKDKVVTLKYRLANDKGEELEATSEEHPFTYLHGARNIIPGLEKGLEGLKTGDKKKIQVSAKEGYGEVDESARATMNRSQFPDDMKIQAGDTFRVKDPKGGATIFTITKIEGDKVDVDANHPLAGENLHFDIEVLEVRDATDEEKTHGHVHDGDDHHHH